MLSQEFKGGSAFNLKHFPMKSNFAELIRQSLFYIPIFVCLFLAPNCTELNTNFKQAVLIRASVEIFHAFLSWKCNLKLVAHTGFESGSSFESSLRWNFIRDLNKQATNVRRLLDEHKYNQGFRWHTRTNLI